MTIGIPDAYDGREQSFIKHELLKNYLPKLFVIIGMGGPRGGRIDLCYVDCFAGPWGDDSERMETTSIAISLRTLEECRQALALRGIDASIRALYVEKDGTAFGRLSEYITCSTPSGIVAEALHGDFVDLRGAIRKWAGEGAFAFFFIDPTGWKDIGIATLRPLLERPRSEFLVNFMYDFINRTMSMPAWKKDMDDLLGEPLDLDGLAPWQREQRILRAYRTNLKSCVPTLTPGYRARSGYARVLDRTRNRPKYHLIYVTTHPLGIVEFMDASEGTSLVQKRVRSASKVAYRNQVTGMEDLFGADAQINPSDGDVSAASVDSFWRNYLRGGSRRIGLKDFADMLEITDWFPGELQASLVRLIAAGQVRNLDARGRRPRKPLHFDTKPGERLELTEHGQ